MAQTQLSLWRLLAALCCLMIMTQVSSHSSSYAGGLAPLIRLDPQTRPLHYGIDLRIDPRAKVFHGLVAIDVEMKQPQTRIILHAQGMTFSKLNASYNGGNKIARLTELAGDGTVALEFDEPIGPGIASLSFEYSAPYAHGLEGLYRVIEGGQQSAFTQFQAIGARRAFPCFDEPGFKAVFDVTLHVPAQYQAVSNTGEQSAKLSQDGMVAHIFAATKPLPTYLVAFAVGDFDVVNAPDIPASAHRATPIPLRGIAMRGKGKEMKIALNFTARLLAVEEDYFAIAYPFDKLDIIAVPDFGAGGMENAGAITYDESIILMDDDAGLKRRRDFLSIHAHELTHQWFGNLVTLHWWDDLWLNESFATFMESKFAAIIEPGWRFETDILSNAHEAMMLDRLQSVRRVNEPVETLDGISTAFDAITYQKGSVLLAMVEASIGAAEFRAFTHDFLSANAYGSMDTVKFLSALEMRKGGADAARSLSSYVFQTGLPLITVKRDDNGLELTQARTKSGGSAESSAVWDVPVCLAGPTGADANCYTIETNQKYIGNAKLAKAAIIPVDEVPRYYAFDLAPADWETALQGIATMPGSRALAVAINFDIAFMDGRISLDAYLKGIDKIAKHPDWEVAGFPVARLHGLAGKTKRCAGISGPVMRQINEQYANILTKIGLTTEFEGDDVHAWLNELKREHLVILFAETGADLALQSKLAALGNALAANPDEDLADSDIAPRDIVGAALIAASLTGADPFLNLAVSRLKATDDLFEREQWLEAIAVNDAANSSRVVEQLLLSQDLRNQEIPTLLFARAASPGFGSETWDIVERHAPELLARLDGDLDITLIQIANEFSTDELADRVEATIRPLLGTLRGGEVQLRQTLEQIRMNAAFLKRLTAAAECKLP